MEGHLIKRSQERSKTFLNLNIEQLDKSQALSEIILYCFLWMTMKEYHDTPINSCHRALKNAAQFTKEVGDNE